MWHLHPVFSLFFSYSFSPLFNRNLILPSSFLVVLCFIRLLSFIFNRHLFSMYSLARLSLCVCVCVCAFMTMRSVSYICVWRWTQSDDLFFFRHPPFFFAKSKRSLFRTPLFQRMKRIPGQHKIHKKTRDIHCPKAMAGTNNIDYLDKLVWEVIRHNLCELCSLSMMGKYMTNHIW